MKITVMIERYLIDQIVRDLQKKMVFVSGPRQVGKTTVSHQIIKLLGIEKISDNIADRYLTWDKAAHREQIMSENFPTAPGPLVLDELHKYARWRGVVKGLYDTRKDELKILVTGSAKLDYYRRGGDSLQGRYHHLRLHPLSLKELKDDRQETVADLLKLGGFPEPFFSGSEVESRRWNNEYRTRLIKEELSDLERVDELSLLERMALRLPDLVASPLSINSLREELEVAHKTAARWITLLERVYHIFRIYPFGAASIRAVKKEAKHYHFNWSYVKSPGARFENMIACHLLKEAHFVEDTTGLRREVRYFRDKDRREVDFVLMEEDKPIYFIECKLSDKNVSPDLNYLHDKFPDIKSCQVILEPDCDFITKKGVRVCSARRFLSELVV